uniref:Uncharacterized protein n=1 Tax=Rhizobium rhizogenes TaxID=359 RepID=A0A7S4ZT63_RHIRH|nr:hypothetical protein pC6.5d_694 [Rhizobium rhizogenes]
MIGAACTEADYCIRNHGSYEGNQLRSGNEMSGYRTRAMHIGLSGSSHSQLPLPLN